MFGWVWRARLIAGHPQKWLKMPAFAAPSGATAADVLPSASVATTPRGDGATSEERTLQAKIAYAISALPVERRVAYLLNFAFQVRSMRGPVAAWPSAALTGSGGWHHPSVSHRQELSSKVHTVARARAVLVLLQVASPTHIEREITMVELR